MSNKEKAIEIVENNIELIEKELTENGFFFEDQLNEKIYRSVAEYLSRTISERLNVDCISLAYDIKKERRAIYYLTEANFSNEFCEELLETRY